MISEVFIYVSCVWPNFLLDLRFLLFPEAPSIPRPVGFCQMVAIFAKAVTLSQDKYLQSV